MTNNTKHTPGPWEIGKAKDFLQDNLFGGYISINSPHHLGLAQVVTKIKGENNTKHEAELQANARLIAAAPELLQALESILEIEALRTKDCNVSNVGALTELLRDIAGTARTAIRKVAA